MGKTKKSAEELSPVVLTLVTDQFHCRRLITAGRLLADRLGASLEVVNVSDPGRAGNPEAIEFLFQASRDQGAAMTIHYSPRPERFLGELIRERRPAAVVTGLPGEGSDLLRKLWLRFDAVEFYLVDQEGALRPVGVLDKAEAGRDESQGILPYIGLTPAHLTE